MIISCHILHAYTITVTKLFTENSSTSMISIQKVADEVEPLEFFSCHRLGPAATQRETQRALALSTHRSVKARHRKNTSGRLQSSYR
jgi:hypothetical protein